MSRKEGEEEEEEKTKEEEDKETQECSKLSQPTYAMLEGTSPDIVSTENLGEYTAKELEGRSTYEAHSCWSHCCCCRTPLPCTE